MQDGVVLNIGLRADADRAVVAADDRVRPDAGALADGDIANHLRAGIDVGGGGNLGRDATIRTKHDGVNSHANKCRYAEVINARQFGPSKARERRRISLETHGSTMRSVIYLHGFASGPQS